MSGIDISIEIENRLFFPIVEGWEWEDYRVTAIILTWWKYSITDCEIGGTTLWIY